MGSSRRDRPAPLTMVAGGLVALWLGLAGAITSAQETPLPEDDHASTKRFLLEQQALQIEKPLHAECDPSDLVEYARLRADSQVPPGKEDLIDRVVKCKLYQMTQMTDLKDRPQIARERQILFSDIHFQNDSRGVFRGDQSFGHVVTEACVRYAPDLMDNHFLVRLNVMVLLASLRHRTDLELAVPVMIQELTNPEQIEAVKLWACVGIRRMAELGFLDLGLKNEAMDAVLSLLRENEQPRMWTRLRAIQALGALRQTHHPLRGEEGEVLWELLKVVSDPKAHPRERCEAVHALSQLEIGFTLEPNYALLVHETAKLAVSLAQELLAHPELLRANEDKAWWQYYFGLLIESFQGDPSVKQSGFLHLAEHTPHQQLVNEAHQHILPVAELVWKENPQKLQEPLAALEEWIEQHPVEDRRVVPNLPSLPLPTPEPSIQPLPEPRSAPLSKSAEETPQPSSEAASDL